MAHSHPDASVSSSSNVHGHPWNAEVYTGYTTCGYKPTTPSHRHTFNDPSEGGSHNHSLTVHFGSANLGSPNWWEHAHPVTVDVPNAGPTHNDHSIPSPTASSRCSDCTLTQHGHGISSWTFTNQSFPHMHTFAGGNTGNADQSGTPENHKHPFSLTLDATTSTHEHARSGGNTDLANCNQGISHNHYGPSTSNWDEDGHNHTGSGNSGYGGEPAAAPVPNIVGDGLTFVVA